MATEVDAVTRLYDYLLWLVPKLEKFPLSQKYLIGDRLESLLLDILDLLVEAAYTRNKAGLLQRANIKLEQLRYLVRLAKDLKLLSLNGYEFSARAINEIGVSVGGWLRYARHEKP